MRSDFDHRRVADHVEDLRRLGGAPRRVRRHPLRGRLATGGHLTRHVGLLLIRAGHRLAGPAAATTYGSAVLPGR